MMSQLSSWSRAGSTASLLIDECLTCLDAGECALVPIIRRTIQSHWTGKVSRFALVDKVLEDVYDHRLKFIYSPYQERKCIDGILNEMIDAHTSPPSVIAAAPGAPPPSVPAGISQEIAGNLGWKFFEHFLGAMSKYRLIDGSQPYKDWIPQQGPSGRSPMIPTLW
ncbi:hypothetical protein N656DRAFT_190427 [Canariomyces notabilis]|uniref:Uncharacterized protein n=1 Tax=Canariomyces notabilis TaxID=2074819 RepID=A0AAN6QPC8_9PEZI|nr:hypothetical protein N656DRAFT_190427 [Canariomyces arenarius]